MVVNTQVLIFTYLIPNQLPTLIPNKVPVNTTFVSFLYTSTASDIVSKKCFISLTKITVFIPPPKKKDWTFPALIDNLAITYKYMCVCLCVYMWKCQFINMAKTVKQSELHQRSTSKRIHIPENLLKWVVVHQHHWTTERPLDHTYATMTTVFSITTNDCECKYLRQMHWTKCQGNEFG